jgi:hypothetical protein
MSSVIRTGAIPHILQANVSLKLEEKDKLHTEKTNNVALEKIQNFGKYLFSKQHLTTALMAGTFVCLFSLVQAEMEEEEMNYCYNNCKAMSDMYNNMHPYTQKGECETFRLGFTSLGLTSCKSVINPDGFKEYRVYPDYNMNRNDLVGSDWQQFLLSCITSCLWRPK